MRSQCVAKIYVVSGKSAIIEFGESVITFGIGAHSLYAWHSIALDWIRKQSAKISRANPIAQSDFPDRIVEAAHHA